jgi:hypothetical protein
MENQLFKPQTLDLPEHLVLIPQFWDKHYYETLKKSALGCFNLLLSDVLLFEKYTVIVGFLGYPHILTLLEFVRGIRDKEVFFLGTAGSLTETLHTPTPLTVVEINSTELLDHFSTETCLPLKRFPGGDFRDAKGVTVDIIQRETPSWLRKQVKRQLDFVEMELFPLRVYLGKPFYAVVVTSDLLKESGVEVFPDKKQLQREFVRSYELIIKAINNKATSRA